MTWLACGGTHDADHQYARAEVGLWAGAEVTPDRFFLFIISGAIRVVLTATSPPGVSLVTADQAQCRARSMLLRSSHISNGVT